EGPRAKLHYLLVIDELDRIEQDEDFVAFIRPVIDGLPDNLKMAFNARRLTLEAFTIDVQNDDVLVVGTENRTNNLVFEKQEGEIKPQIEVYAFGSGHVLVNGRPIESWDGALPRLLFYFFVDKQRVTRADIFSTFWSSLSRKEATNVFHVTKRKITECISDCVLGKGNYELTRYESGFYVASDKLVRNYDVAEFEDALAKAASASNDDEQAEALNRAIDLYRFPFLMDYDMPWITERREKLRTMYADALIDMARLHQKREDYTSALGFYTRALKEMPQREDVYRDTMLMYWNLERHGDAIAQYNLLAEHLKSTVGVSPSRDTTELHDKIIADA
ncbi:MAG: bacterial transcriptional activator domain-containing protein, partial [Anaerolineae bacterium]|nr:bacterial transcriptional activator domain-containing protein [Anaerolineae bacterium]